MGNVVDVAAQDGHARVEKGEEPEFVQARLSDYLLFFGMTALSLALMTIGVVELVEHI